jgi:hypothetical protein
MLLGKSLWQDKGAGKAARQGRWRTVSDPFILCKPILTWDNDAKYRRRSRDVKSFSVVSPTDQAKMAFMKHSLAKLGYPIGMPSTNYGPSESEDNNPQIGKEPSETESSSHPYSFYHRRERRGWLTHVYNGGGFPAKASCTKALF